VLIEDGGTIVLGGLIQDTQTGGEQRVPFLGRIPIVGEAFRTRSAKKNKTNLMVFIQPRILRDGTRRPSRPTRSTTTSATSSSAARNGNVCRCCPAKKQVLPSCRRLEPADQAPEGRCGCRRAHATAAGRRAAMSPTGRCARHATVRTRAGPRGAPRRPTAPKP
jgi:Flp pilus assembly secretin CpaC